MKKIMTDRPAAVVADRPAAKKAEPAVRDRAVATETTPASVPPNRGGAGRSDRQVGDAGSYGSDRTGEAVIQQDGSAPVIETGAPTGADKPTDETPAAADDDGKAAKKKQIIDTAREAYIKEHGGTEGENKAEAEAAFEQQRTILETSPDAGAILAAQESIGMPYGQLVDYLQGDERRGEVQLTAVLNQIGKTIDAIDADESLKPAEREERKAQIEKWRKPFTDLFTGDDRSTRIEAAALFLPEARAVGKNIQQYLEGVVGYTDEPSFFADVEALGRTQGKISSQETPPAGQAASGGVEAVPLDPKAAEAQAAIQARAAEAAKDIDTVNNPEATEDEKEQSRLNLKEIGKDLFKWYGKLWEYILIFGGGGLALVGIPTLLMASIHGGGGK